MPGTSGFVLMDRIREVSAAPIIFLSMSNQDKYVVKALGMGADDYMNKPFSSAELLARVGSVLRRRGAGVNTAPRRPFRYSDLTIDYVGRNVTISGCTVPLSPTEYKLLTELSFSAGRVLTRDQILHKVWGSEYSGARELLRATVKNLRRKLGDNANDPQYIITERRVGYWMANPS